MLLWKLMAHWACLSFNLLKPLTNPQGTHRAGTFLQVPHWHSVTAVTSDRYRLGLQEGVGCGEASRIWLSCKLLKPLKENHG